MLSYATEKSIPEYIGMATIHDSSKEIIIKR